jgi:hypothetical protein
VLDVPAHITFETNSGGTFEIIFVFGEMDCFEDDRVEFSWVGNDEMDPASGEAGPRSARTDSSAGGSTSTRATIRRLARPTKRRGPSFTLR